MDPVSLVLAAGVGVAAGVINTIAGGGSMLTLPALVFLGLDVEVANGTNRLGVLVQSGAATTRFQREGLVAAPAWVEAVPAGMGAVIGAVASLVVGEVFLERALVVVMLGMAAWMATQQGSWEQAREPAGPWLRALVFFGIGLYGGFLQAGVGVVLLGSLVTFGGHDAVHANTQKVVLVGGFTALSLAVFVFYGSVAWVPAIALAAGMAVGGWLGARWTISGGAQLVRWGVIAAITLAAARLLWTSVR